MRRLAGAAELLDGPLDDPDALRGHLRDLVWINRRLGGMAASRRAIDRLLDGRSGPHSLLDVGAGAADIPFDLIAGASRTPRPLRITALDSRQEVLDAAVDLEPRLLDGAGHGLELVVGDGLALPWTDGTFDIVHASLVVHHFEAADAIAFLVEAARVSRRGVVVNDLVRARRHWLGARVVFALMTRNRITRHDGPLSVRRAYTRVELRALLAAAGLRPIAEEAALGGHRVAIAAIRIPPAVGP